jgi:hypothetical protein
MKSFAFNYFMRSICLLIVILAVFILYGHVKTDNARSYTNSDSSKLNDSDESINDLSVSGALLNTTPIQCQVFDDGYSRLSGLSDAIYVQENLSLCTPGSGTGTCRKWFGKCTTLGLPKLNVLFRVHDDEDKNRTGLSDAVYIKGPNKSCIPDGTPDGSCRRWFGFPQAQDGRQVTCRLFNDGYTDMTAPTRSIYYNSSGKVCMPGGDEGVCRKWFGKCEIAPTCASYTYSAWGACNEDGTQTRTVIGSVPSGCAGGTAVTMQTCAYTSSNGPEKCFGAVGSQCNGAPGAPAVNLQNGYRRMKVSVGSIAHDTCCARNPDGKWCGKYQEIGHNGQCDMEWNKAFWNVIDGRMWEHDFNANTFTDSALVSNPRSATFNPNYLGGGVIRLRETRSSIILSAPRGTALDVGDEQFCASKRAVQKSSPFKRWIICQ